MSLGLLYDVHGNLPALEAPGVLFCHGSPASDVRSFFPEPGRDDEELMADAEHPRLVFGHTHLPFARVGPRAVELVNPGSVGMPLDGDPRAAYGVMRGDGPVEHRRVSYDHRASAEAIRERIGPGGEQAARRVERASFDA